MLGFILLQTTLKQLRQRDGGPLYTETNLSQWIVEPWNAASAFIFLLIVIYWAIRLKGIYQQYRFMSVSTAMLAVGGVGGIIYHAFRMSPVFLYMDWLPIMILCLAVSIYFIVQLSKNWTMALAVLAGSVMVQISILRSGWISDRWAVSINYIWMALMVLIPTALIIYKTRFHKAQYVFYALGAFVLAIFFRIADPWQWLPMGTHFLWHFFGAIACHSMFYYVYSFKKYQLQYAVVIRP